MNIWMRLFCEFFKTGLFSVGGGLATLPFIQEMGIKTGWFTGKDIADMVAVSEATPGPLGVNMATYVGYKSAGLLGGLVATIGLVTPSIIVILMISKILSKFRELMIVQWVFYGLRPASVALIGAAGLHVAGIALLNLEVYRDSGEIGELLNWKCILLAAVIYAVYRKFKVHPVVYIGAAAVAGILFQL